MKKSKLVIRRTIAMVMCILTISGAAIVTAEADEGKKEYEVLVERQQNSIGQAAVDFDSLRYDELEVSQLVNGSELMTRATSRIEWTVSPHKVGKANQAYSLEADELVTINCTYSPRTADVDFGFMTPDNRFHFVSGKDGNIHKTIRITDTGKYYFAVRNNTNREIEVLGYVYY